MIDYCRYLLRDGQRTRSGPRTQTASPYREQRRVQGQVGRGRAQEDLVGRERGRFGESRVCRVRVFPLADVMSPLLWDFPFSMRRTTRGPHLRGGTRSHRTDRSGCCCNPKQLLSFTTIMSSDDRSDQDRWLGNRVDSLSRDPCVPGRLTATHADGKGRHGTRIARAGTCKLSSSRLPSNLPPGQSVIDDRLAFSAYPESIQARGKESLDIST